MIIDHKIMRNSGATLEPCIHKSGAGVYEQGLKMAAYPDVFAPVLGFTMLEGTFTGYTMPIMREPVSHYDSETALVRLCNLWESSVDYGVATTRLVHHEQQVLPYADVHPTLHSVLIDWWGRTEATHGRLVSVVHGDPTTENYMRDGWWLDPSIRPMPREAELDGGKLLQSYFGYGAGASFGSRMFIRKFLHEQKLDIDLCVYYMVTHIVRLYRIQTHARPWALDLLSNLEEKVEELKCK